MVLATVILVCSFCVFWSTFSWSDQWQFRVPLILHMTTLGDKKGIRSCKYCSFVSTGRACKLRKKTKGQRSPSLIFRFYYLKQGALLLSVATKEQKKTSIFYLAMLCIRGTSHGPVSVSLSVSVTSRSSTKTAKQRITQTTPHDTPGL